MDYKVFYRKYRPQNFDELVGQDHIKDLLLKSIVNNKLSHAYLFTGPRGTGKTSTAKLFAKTINCENCLNGIPCNKCPACVSYNETVDILEIDAASNNGVDEIRELRENVKILPTFSKYKVYIIDEVHMLSSSAWNAFLKTLEEPPHHVIFILATTEIQKVPITVLSRCQRFDFQKLSAEVIASHIDKIAKNEKIKITSEAINEIATLADGSLRDGLSILDQLSKLDLKIDVDTITSAYGILSTNDVENLLKAVSTGDVATYVKNIDEIQKKGIDANALLNKLLEHLLHEAISSKVTGQKKYAGIKQLESLIFALENCYNKSNQYILIKTALLSFCEKNERIFPIEKPAEIELKDEKKAPEIISREIILPVKDKKTDQDLIQIRINNAYVDASISLKKEFVKLWDEFIGFLTKNDELKYLALLKECSIEVVSPTNIIVSTEYYTNSVLFNELASEIESKLKKVLNIEKKLICLDTENWHKEKSEYIKNKKTKKYTYIEEPLTEIISEAVNEAENLFGNELIEIN